MRIGRIKLSPKELLRLVLMFDPMMFWANVYEGANEPVCPSIFRHNPTAIIQFR